MAQVDSRIAMGVQPLDIGGAVGRGYQLRDLAAQADARTLDTQIKQQALKKQGTLADLHRLNTQDGKLNRQGFAQGMVDAGYGADLPAMQKEWGEGDKAELERKAKTLENSIKANDYITGQVAGVLMKPGRTPADAYQAIERLAQAGIMSAEQAVQYRSQVPTDNPQALDNWLRQMLGQSLEGKERLAALMPKPEAVNLGGTTQMVDTNPNTNPGIVGQTYRRTVTPEAELSADTARRGQDKTDIRARDLNATKAEEAKIKREAKDDAASQAKAGQLASFDTMLGTLDRLGKHPGLSRSVGVIGALPTMPGSESANFQAELETFKSQAFIPMVAQLKGMGALSDAEGKKLSAAVGALDPKMGEKAFRESVARIVQDMKMARDRLASSGKQAANPAPGGGVLSLKPAQGNPALEQARAAIAAGADPARVAERLQSMGIDARGLSNGNDSRTGAW